MGNCLGKESPPPMADRGAELHEVSNRSTASEAPVTQPLPPPQAQPTRQAAASPPSPQLRRRPQDQKPAPNEVFVEDTTVEHISDREDIREKEARIMTSVRPSSTGSPKARRQSSSEAFKSPKRQVSQQALEAGLDGLHNAKKFNSTSTLFVDSTASQPNKQETIKCVVHPSTRRPQLRVPLSVFVFLKRGAFTVLYDTRGSPKSQSRPVQQHLRREIFPPDGGRGSSKLQDDDPQ
eukprot:m.193381 g.193381  ORF g.193381 m.193381 type:complete len:236 (-) comp53685_c0_seq2:1100-1807(-)